jgi:hypothetical protein
MKKFIKKVYWILKSFQNRLQHKKYVEVNARKHLLKAHEALDLMIKMLPKHAIVLDIGAGKDLLHTTVMEQKGLHVETCDFFDNATHKGFYEDIKFEEKYDGIWLAHVLEHILDVDRFLKKINNDAKEGGIVAITVPPLKHDIVGGHVNLFNGGLLLYRMVLAGFDCSDAKVKRYGYNISVIVRVKKIKNLPPLNYDNGDIEILKDYFPLKAVQGFDGDIKSLNWSAE